MKISFSSLNWIYSYGYQNEIIFRSSASDPSKQINFDFPVNDKWRWNWYVGTDS
jgi:hypothetical protein